MTPEQREKRREYIRNRYANMTPDQKRTLFDRINAWRAKKKVEQPEKRALYLREWYSNMPPEQKQKFLENKSILRRKRYESRTPDEKVNLKECKRKNQARFELARQIGVSTREVPVELLETKVAVLNVKRKVRELMK